MRGKSVAEEAVRHGLADQVIPLSASEVRNSSYEFEHNTAVTDYTRVKHVMSFIR